MTTTYLPMIALPGTQILNASAAATKITNSNLSNAGNSKSSNPSCVSKNKRKRVQWEEDSETQDVKRRIVSLPHMESFEREQLWMQKPDYEKTLQAALNDVVAAKTSTIPALDATGNNNLAIGSYYAEAMAQTYSLCCSPNAKSSIALENVALLSLLDSSFRGLENHTLPREMRVDRKVRKAKTVGRVLELQGELRVAGNPDEDATECLRLVSEYFSEPSRKFARALGEIDGTFVNLET